MSKEKQSAPQLRIPYVPGEKINGKVPAIFTSVTAAITATRKFHDHYRLATQ